MPTENQLISLEKDLIKAFDRYKKSVTNFYNGGMIHFNSYRDLGDRFPSIDRCPPPFQEYALQYVVGARLEQGLFYTVHYKPKKHGLSEEAKENIEKFMQSIQNKEYNPHLAGVVAMYLSNAQSFSESIGILASTIPD